METPKFEPRKVNRRRSLRNLRRQSLLISDDESLSTQMSTLNVTGIEDYGTVWLESESSGGRATQRKTERRKKFRFSASSFQNFSPEIEILRTAEHEALTPTIDSPLVPVFDISLSERGETPVIDRPPIATPQSSSVSFSPSVHLNLSTPFSGTRNVSGRDLDQAFLKSDESSFEEHGKNSAETGANSSFVFEIPFSVKTDDVSLALNQSLNHFSPSCPSPLRNSASGVMTSSCSPVISKEHCKLYPTSERKLDGSLIKGKMNKSVLLESQTSPKDFDSRPIMKKMSDVALVGNDSLKLDSQSFNLTEDNIFSIKDASFKKSMSCVHNYKHSHHGSVQEGSSTFYKRFSPSNIMTIWRNIAATISDLYNHKSENDSSQDASPFNFDTDTKNACNLDLETSSDITSEASTNPENSKLEANEFGFSPHSGENPNSLVAPSEENEAMDIDCCISEGQHTKPVDNTIIFPCPEISESIDKTFEKVDVSCGEGAVDQFLNNFGEKSVPSTKENCDFNECGSINTSNASCTGQAVETAPFDRVSSDLHSVSAQPGESVNQKIEPRKLTELSEKYVESNVKVTSEFDSNEIINHVGNEENIEPCCKTTLIKEVCNENMVDDTVKSDLCKILDQEEVQHVGPVCTIETIDEKSCSEYASANQINDSVQNLEVGFLSADSCNGNNIEQIMQLDLPHCTVSDSNRVKVRPVKSKPNRRFPSRRSGIYISTKENVKSLDDDLMDEINDVSSVLDSNSAGDSAQIPIEEEMCFDFEKIGDSNMVCQKEISAAENGGEKLNLDNDLVLLGTTEPVEVKKKSSKKRRRSADYFLNEDSILCNNLSANIPEEDNGRYSKRLRRKSNHMTNLEKPNIELRNDVSELPNTESMDIVNTDSVSAEQTIDIPVKKSRRKKQKPEVPLEDIYQNKNFKQPEEKLWETIYESPGKKKQPNVTQSQKRFRRSIQFETYQPAKLKKRIQRASKMGWTMKGRKTSLISKEVFDQKLEDISNELGSDS